MASLGATAAAAATTARGTPRRRECAARRKGRRKEEGVRVRVRGWRSNKELLRYDRQTAATWPHYGRFSPTQRLFSLHPLPRLFPFLSVHATKPAARTRQYVMLETPVRPVTCSSYRSTWNRRSVRILYISLDAGEPGIKESLKCFDRKPALRASPRNRSISRGLRLRSTRFAE